MRHLRLSIVLAATLVSLAAVSSASAANTAPICTSPGFSQQVAPGRVTQLSVSCSDADGDILSYKVVDPPQHGTVSPQTTYGPIFYQADASYGGTDSFTVRANDGSLDSAELATVSVTAAAAAAATAPGPPTGCPTDAFSAASPYPVRPNGSRMILLALLTCTGGGTTSVQVTTPPAHGTLTGPSFAPIYTPVLGYTGSDTIGYKRVNAFGSSNEITWHLGVADGSGAVPQCSVASPTSVRNDAPRTITLSCLDEDIEPVTFRVVNPPQHGTLSAVTPAPFTPVAGNLQPAVGTSRATVTYTPVAGYVGPDSFTVVGDDGRQVSTVRTASFAVTAPDANTAPTCSPASATTTAGQAVRLSVYCPDAEGDAGTIAVLAQPSDGVLSSWTAGPTDGLYTAIYTPAAGFVGGDLATVRVTDSRGAAGAAKTATITVAGAGYASTTSTTMTCARVLNVTRNTALTTAGNACVTPDGSAPAVSITVPPAHGTATVSPSGALSYTPARNYLGPDTLTVHAVSGSNTMDYILLVEVTSGARTTILSGPAVDSADHAPSFTLYGESGVTLTCALSNSPASTPTPCTGTKSYTAVPAGDHVLTVTATDGASRTGTDTYAFTITDPPSGSGGGGPSGGSGGGGAPSGGSGGGSGSTSGGGTTTTGPAVPAGSAPSGARASRTAASALAALLAALPGRTAMLSAHGATVRFTAPQTGRLTIGWTTARPGHHATSTQTVLVASGTRVVRTGSTATMPVKLTSAGRTLLRAAHRPITVKVTATFTPTGGGRAVHRTTTATLGHR